MEWALLLGICGGALALAWWFRPRTGGSPEPGALRRHRALGTPLFHTDAESVDTVTDVEALVAELDAFTGGAMRLGGVRCETAGGLRLLSVETPKGWLRGTMDPLSGWIDADGLLPLLNGALAHAGDGRRLAVAESGWNDQSLSIAFVDRALAEALAAERLLCGPDGFDPVDVDTLFGEPVPLGGPMGFVDGRDHALMALDAEGPIVAVVRDGRGAIWRHGRRSELEGLHPEAYGVCIDGGEVLAPTEAGVLIDAGTATRLVEIDGGRVVALHRRAGRLAVVLETPGTTDNLLVILKDAVEEARWPIPYGGTLVRWSDDGERLALALEGEGLRILTAEGEELGRHGMNGVGVGLDWQGMECAVAFDTGGMARWTPDGVVVDEEAPTALAFGPGGLAIGTVDDRVVLPDGTERAVGRPVFDLAWGDSLWSVADDGWLVEVVHG